MAGGREANDRSRTYRRQPAEEKTRDPQATGQGQHSHEDQGPQSPQAVSGPPQAVSGPPQAVSGPPQAFPGPPQAVSGPPQTLEKKGHVMKYYLDGGMGGMAEAEAGASDKDKAWSVMVTTDTYEPGIPAGPSISPGRYTYIGPSALPTPVQRVLDVFTFGGPSGTPPSAPPTTPVRQPRPARPAAYEQAFAKAVTAGREKAATQKIAQLKKETVEMKSYLSEKIVEQQKEADQLAGNLRKLEKSVAAARGAGLEVKPELQARVWDLSEKLKNSRELLDAAILDREKTIRGIEQEKELYESALTAPKRPLLERLGVKEPWEVALEKQTGAKLLRRQSAVEKPSVPVWPITIKSSGGVTRSLYNMPSGFQWPKTKMPTTGMAVRPLG